MKRLLLVLSSAFFILSCDNKDSIQPESAAPDQSRTEKVELIEGVLSFASKEQLTDVTKGLSIQSDVQNWYKNPKFESLLKRQNAISEQQTDKIASSGDLGSLSDVFFFYRSGEEVSLNKIVEDPRFAAVLNAKNFVIVADTIYHISAEHVTYIPVGNNKENLKPFLANPSMHGVLKTSVKREYLRGGNSLRTSDATIPNPYDNKRRIVAEFVKNDVGVYKSLLVKVKYQKKNWIGWSGTNAYSLSFSASGYFSEAGVPFPFSGSRSGSETEEISMFVSETYNLGLGWVSTSGTGTCRPGPSDPLISFNF